MESIGNVSFESVLNSLSNGVYLCDLVRRIVYWNEAASRITGWKREDVVGKHCFDNVLCHVDKDGHELCVNEFCPLHRSMVTAQLSQVSQLVYAMGANGKRVPMEVTVAPIENEDGTVVGGVEVFRDASSVVNDLEHAKTIQQFAMETDIPEGIGLNFKTHYISHDIVGGDYYALKDLGDECYGFILADVMGHGIAAALYTMHLSALWNRYHPLLTNTVEFVSEINNKLGQVVQQEGAFATALCGLVDMKDNVLKVSSAGGPEVVVFHADGTHECLEVSGLPLGLISNTEYEEASFELEIGDNILLFSDGAVEVENVDGKMLGTSGLIEILKKQNYPQKPLKMDRLEEALLTYSNAIRLDDDLTMIEIQFQPVS